jgi:hypothetical protein
MNLLAQAPLSLGHGLRCNTWDKSALCFPLLRCSCLSKLILTLLLKPISGYANSCKSIVTTARTIISAIETEIPELYILGSPPASCVAFTSRPLAKGKGEEVDVLAVGDRMSQRGWHLNGLSAPKAVHIACTVSVLSRGSYLLFPPHSGKYTRSIGRDVCFLTYTPAVLSLLFPRCLVLSTCVCFFSVAGCNLVPLFLLGSRSSKCGGGFVVRPWPPGRRSVYTGSFCCPSLRSSNAGLLHASQPSSPCLFSDTYYPQKRAGCVDVSLASLYCAGAVRA